MPKGLKYSCLRKKGAIITTTGVITIRNTVTLMSMAITTIIAMAVKL